MRRPRALALLLFAADQHPARPRRRRLQAPARRSHLRYSRAEAQALEDQGARQPLPRREPAAARSDRGQHPRVAARRRGPLAHEENLRDALMQAGLYSREHSHLSKLSIKFDEYYTCVTCAVRSIRLYLSTHATRAYGLKRQVNVKRTESDTATAGRRRAAARPGGAAARRPATAASRIKLSK